MVTRPPNPLLFHARLFSRFHLVPLARDALGAVKANPGLFLVAGLMAAAILFRPGASAPGFPPDLAPPEGWRGAVLAVLAALGTVGLSAPLGSLASRRREFYSARPGGPTALAWYAFFRLLAGWALVSGALWWLLGNPDSWGAVFWLVSGPLVCGPLARWRTAAPHRSRRPPVRLLRTPRLAALPAWWSSHPALFFGPFAVTLVILGWAWSGGGGFVWSDHPPVAALVTDFLWPTLFGFVWADVGTQIPHGYFRIGSAPRLRVLAALGAPVLVETLAVVALAAALSASWMDAGRAVALNLAGTAFWFFGGLRWGRATLLTFALSWAVLVVGLGTHDQWWGVWVLVLVGGALFWAGSWSSSFDDPDSGKQQEGPDA